jgi:tRNA A37 threonylcarbamoyladenosine modification protein TsaB
MNLLINQICSPQELVITTKNWQLQAQILPQGQTSRQLVENIAELCKMASIRACNLSQIYLINGPGHFTPVRLTTVVANSLAWSLNLLIADFSSTLYTQFLATTTQNRSNLVEFCKLSSNGSNPKKQILAAYGRAPI